MSVKCFNCGCEFDSNFCPNCGTKREDCEVKITPAEGVTNNQEEKADAQPEVTANEAVTIVAAEESPKVSFAKKIGRFVLNVIKWFAFAMFIFLAIMSLTAKGFASCIIFALAAAFCLTKFRTFIRNKLPKIKFSLGFYIGVIFVLFIAGVICFPLVEPVEVPATDIEQPEVVVAKVADPILEESVEPTVEAKVESTPEIKEEVVEEVIPEATAPVFDKKSLRTIKKIEKNISKQKYDKALELIKSNDFGASENTRLYEEYYIAKGDEINAIMVLESYIKDLNPLSLANEDPRYGELLALKEKHPYMAEEIGLVEHSVLVATVGPAKGHDWIAVTCVEPKTCSVCGETSGIALGHSWIDATCTDAKTCERCGETEGEPLGHTVEKWKTETKPTCVELGSEVGICTVCGEEARQDIEMLEHDLGDWEITSTNESTGTRIKKCKSCGNAIEAEDFTLSEEEKMNIYKEKCVSVTYDDLIRYPEKYEGQPIKCTVYIKDVETVDSMLFQDQYEGVLSKKTISVFDGREVKEPKFRPGDNVTIYGEGKGYNTQYKYQRGLILGLPKNIETEKIPAISVKYAIIK